MFKYLLVAAITFQVTTLNAQQPSKKAQPIKKPEPITEIKNTIETPEEKPFTPKFLETGTPINEYAGNDAKKIYEWVNRLIASVPGKPDEFSSKEDRKVYQQALHERFKSTGQIPIISNCMKKYDAETQRFDIRTVVFPIKNHYLIKEVDARGMNIRFIRLLTDNVKKDTYTGQNAYGAETEIQRTTSDSYVFAFPLNESPSDSMSVDTGRTDTYETDYRSVRFTVPMASNDARENYKDIACLYVFSLDPTPITFKFVDRNSPTRDSPYDTTLTSYAIYASLEQVAVINKRSGAIYDQIARRK